MKHLSLQRLWILAAEPIIEDAEEKKHLKSCHYCMDAFLWFADDYANHIQNNAELEEMCVVYD